MRLLISGIVALVLVGCSSSDSKDAPSGGGAGGAVSGGSGGTSSGGAAGAASGGTSSGGSAGSGGGAAGSSSGGAAGSGGDCSPTNWPTAQTVGIPSGTPTLKVVGGSSVHTQADGEVFDAVELQARLYVDHKNVVIKRSKLIGDQYYAIYTTIPEAHLTIEDSDIVGGVLITDYFIGRRNHLHAETGGFKDDGYIFSASHVLLEDNLIDGLVGDTGAHLDGIQVMGGTDIVIRHNWIEAVSPPISGGGVNASIFFKPDFDPISDVTVDCNMLIEKDGYYPLRIDAGGTNYVRHNRWQKGHLGAPVLLSGSTTVSVWEDNQYTDGEIIPAP
jgi:hypothetical protein